MQKPFKYGEAQLVLYRNSQLKLEDLGSDQTFATYWLCDLRESTSPLCVCFLKGREVGYSLPGFYQALTIGGFVNHQRLTRR